jgi:RimJ/RimL family protein N-acetyltransferase
VGSPILTTDRLVLRRWTETDIEPFARMNRDVEVMKYFPETLSHEETIQMLDRIRLSFEKNNFGLYAVEDKLAGEFIGFTGFAIPSFESFFTPCVEIGWRLRKESWGQGFATEAAAACLKYGFTTLNFKKVVSFTSALNVNSERVMTRIGMRKVGDFDHPKIPLANILCKHVLYKINNSREL